jgi:hypothetical protein
MSARDAILNKLKASQQPSGAAQAVTFHTADALCAQIDAHFDARRVEVSHAELLQQMQHALQPLQAKVFVPACRTGRSNWRSNVSKRV